MQLEKSPAGWLVLVIGYAMVGGVGFVDYLTGDYSIIIFYILPVFLVAWHLGRWGALHIALAAGLARTISDYFSYSVSTFRYWNSLQDMVFLLMVGLLIAFIKKVLNDGHD